MNNELKYKVNLSFVVFNLLETTFINIKYSPEIKYEFKQAVSNVLAAVKRFNSMAERTLTDSILEDFDKDKETLQLLIDCELAAHADNKQIEYLEYIKNFFEK